MLAFTTETLVGPGLDFPHHYVFVGPAIGVRTGAPEFPWDWLNADRQHVLVSLGTLNREVGQRFFATAVQAVEPLADRLQRRPAMAASPADTGRAAPSQFGG